MMEMLLNAIHSFVYMYINSFDVKDWHTQFM